MTGQGVAHVFRQFSRRPAIDELVQVGVILATSQRGFLQIRWGITMRHQFQDALSLDIELHNRNLNFHNRMIKSFFPIAEY